MRRWLMVLLLALVIGYAPTGQSQSPGPTIYLGSVLLRIGMSQDDLVRLLGDNYIVEEVPGPPQPGYPRFWVRTKLPSGGAGSVLGTVTFSEGILVQVLRDWSPDDQVVAAVGASAICGAIAQLAPDGPTECSIRVENAPVPGWDVKKVILSTGRREIEITVLSGQETRAMISEILR